jgi:hypothetical protein
MTIQRRVSGVTLRGNIRGAPTGGIIADLVVG